MSDWTEQQLLFALHEAQGIGWHTIRSLRERIGMIALHHWLDRSVQHWFDLGLKPSIAERLAAQFRSERLEHRLIVTERQGIEWITVLDDKYPDLLKETAQPPWVIYGKGDWDILSETSIAMVGTRNPTVYGKKVAGMLAEQLTQAGFIVVSGMAKGIDAASHEGALRRGRTVAVMGTPFTRIYPPEHRALAEKIAANGIVISEYPLDTPSHPGLFPRRNRIIAGLTLGTVVVEADNKSGALITADSALEASRDVFAVPGPITSPKSKGTFRLLKQGAKPVATASDIVEEYSGWLTMVPSTYNNETVESILAEPLTEEEQRMYELISEQEASFDELLLRSGVPFAELHHILLSLQLKKRIREAHGAVYCSVWM
ncbi:DNA-processing protein DprA [Paenibacillus apiarius]|uniref:DNA-processing protein DprA n=1 Tax=Paenibacillus apiarius TaxID=46240 RepID=A0ABT4DNM0_9BACL|nr:DNA-processing protein DprA [Paenibacillus apiarius]MCY9516186.1 DNA-processing protein DprA [Paenibacillus apiarius]MCY9518355.1 DNA-processing protein DprA [Paenibacillus apiarius]MCY9551244.1 DNA-processing protein DprA [Paenibacillus apiarius]MCY9558398.1 DNA-processing protein DprA [Paenibacillus apiarius]MCY9684798.1 DNA-processing protein DprA [Paenibacillus apiarius]